MEAAQQPQQQQQQRFLGEDLPTFELTQRELGRFAMTPEAMLAKMAQQGYVDQVSARKRKQLYELLRSRRIHFYSTVLGYLHEHRTELGDDELPVSLVAKFIAHRRILAKDVRVWCDMHNKEYPESQWDFSKVAAAFEPGLSNTQRADILGAGWPKLLDSCDAYYGPFRRARIRVSLVRISLAPPRKLQNLVIQHLYATYGLADELLECLPEQSQRAIRCHAKHMHKTDDPNPQHVLNSLWIGNMHAAENLRQWGIKHIVCCVSLPADKILREFTYLVFKRDDDPRHSMKLIFAKLYAFISEFQRNAEEGVLFHLPTNVGIPRSATLLAAQLMLMDDKLRANDAVSLIRTACSIVKVNEGFMKQLSWLEEHREQVRAQAAGIRRFRDLSQVNEF